MAELVSKFLLSAFAMGYVFVLINSMRRGEILFIQGRGLLIKENRRQFLRHFIYHGVIAGVFATISICSWVFL